MSAVENTETTIIDGRIVDADGLVIGEVSIPDLWVPSTIEEAERVLEKRADAEQKMLALKARLKMYQDNIGVLIATEQRYLDYHERRYDPALAEIAKRELDGKGKTLQLEHGKISFRKSKGTRKILDMDAAVSWAARRFQRAIKTSYSVNVSDLPPEADSEPWMECSGEREILTVTTGIAQ